MSRTGKHEPVEHHDNTDQDHVVVKSDVDPPDEQMEQAEYVNLLRIALTRLSDTCRELVTLRFFSELTYRAIAAKLGSKENTVNVQMIRCMTQLRAAFALLEVKGQRT
jgi:RNA polymerase sigma factor (sigma-70 family)